MNGYKIICNGKSYGTNANTALEAEEKFWETFDDIDPQSPISIFQMEDSLSLQENEFVFF